MLAVAVGRGRQSSLQPESALLVYGLACEGAGLTPCQGGDMAMLKTSLSCWIARALALGVLVATCALVISVAVAGKSSLSVW